MKYRLLGKSGLRVSEAALGTMTFGDEWGWGSPKAEAQKVYETYREAGGNFIDTANFYTGGTSETFLGEFMRGHRESVVLATKYSNAAPYAVLHLGTAPNAFHPWGITTDAGLLTVVASQMISAASPSFLLSFHS